MKGKILFLLSFLFATIISFSTYALPAGSIVINDIPLSFDDQIGQPTLIDGRTYVPLRALGDALGCTTDWLPTSKTAVIKNDTTILELTINNPIARINNDTVSIDSLILTTTPRLIDGRTYMPLRFIVENLGYTLEYKDGVTYIHQPTYGATPIDPWTYQQLLGKGMDVDWSKTSEGKAYYNEQAVKDFKSGGISHVRIRIKDAADEALFASLDQQIADCLKHSLIPVIAYQADEFKNAPTEKNIQKVVEWWRTVATRYQDVSHLLSFDLLIEATDALNKEPDKLNEIYERLVTEIRKTNPTRIIMMSPRLRSDAAYLHELKLPSKHNNYMMAEWHFYAAGPSKTNARKLWTTGTEAEKNLIREKIQLALDWQQATNIPTWVGAWMPGNYNDGNDYTLAEQVVFAEFMTSALTEAGIPFAVNSDTKFYDRTTNTWVAEMLPVRDTIYP